MTYTTISGDTWDMIAFKVYGREMWADKLMKANLAYVDYLVFPAGITLTVPEVSTVTDAEVASDAPVWRAALNS